MLFLIKRLTPFFLMLLAAETIEISYMIYDNAAQLDLSFRALMETFGVLLLTTTISFFHMMIPYVLYLLFLPQRKQNSRIDKIITICVYFIFVFATIFEEVASKVFWDEFASAFNFIAVDYLVYTTEVVRNIKQSYPVALIMSAILTLSILIVFFTGKYNFTKAPSPKLGRRLFNTLIYAGICVLAYTTVDISKLELTENRFNNELAKEGTYSLFSAFLKNELPYKDFYITQDDNENIAILKEKLKADNANFLNTDNITRDISAKGVEGRHNVVIVLMESMSAKFMDENYMKESGGQSITPNLTKLSQEGLYFPNTYATGTRSVRGIEALSLSVLPLPGMSIVRRQNNENLHSLGSIFKEKGYDNKWVYGGFGNFDNMNYFFENNGFNIVDRGAWQKEETTFKNAWGACDEDSFNKIIFEADKSFADNKPFLTFILTISNHRPFTFPDGKIDLVSKTSGRAGGVKYADYAIGKFIEEAKQKPWFNNTIFVFVADHTAGAAGSEEISLEDHHIPLIIYAPKLVKPQRIETEVSQIDALPTLFTILNFNYESRFYGQDALSKNYESRFFVSNYQKIGYVKNGVDVILKPVREYSVEPANSPENIVKENLKEGIAFYQQASNWVKNLKQ